MSKKRQKQAIHCESCGSHMKRPYSGAICYQCFKGESQPDFEFAVYYHIQGHSLDCALDMSDGLVCGCGG